MKRVSDLHKAWLKDDDYRQAYEALTPEFEVAQALIQARARAGLTQAQLAQRMKTTQSVIARLESGHANPSAQTLAKLAKATGSRLRVQFEFEAGEPA